VKRGDWDELERLFTELVDLDPSQRDQRLGAVERSDPALATRLRDLLEHDDRVSDDFLQPGPTAGGDWGVVHEDLLGEGGCELGPYRVRELLFEGGMGRVYLAEQREPLARVVALKVLASPGLAEDVLERFRLEQGALAALNHPNIAAIFDSGLTPAGTPWFAMEYVDGAPITRFAAEHGLGLEERLDVFLQLCDALQHAHESGLVHRDVKPANVLVAERDGQAMSKLIDFGIAKATGTALAAGRTLTQDGLLVGTPEYMSPEQCGTQAHAVGVRSDIYSLGLVLYELITESRPHDWAALREGGIEAILKAIQLEEAPLPSANVGLDEPERTRRARALRGDLDWIVAKAIDKDPARRYASVAELAADLRRRARDEPVLAGPPSTWYRLRKLVRRRALPLAATAAVVSALGTGGGLAAWKAIEAGRDEALRLQAEGLTAWNRYAGSLASAEEALGSNDVAGARRSLGRAPEALRGWEWRQLTASLDDAALLLEPHRMVIRDLDVGPRFAASASLDGELRLWKTQEGFTHASRSLGRAGSSTIALLEDREALAVLTRERRLSITELETGEERLHLAEDVRSFSDILSIPERGEIALGTPQGSVRRWDVESGEELPPLSSTAPAAEIRSLVALPGGDHLVAGSEAGELLCWELGGGTLVASRRLDDEPVRSLAARPSGGQVAAGSRDGTLTLLSTLTLDPGRSLTTDGGTLTDLEWSADGKAVVSASADGRVRRWSAEHGSLLATYRGHARGAVVIEELPGGEGLLSGGADGALRVFDPRRRTARRISPAGSAAGPVVALAAAGDWLVAISPSGSVVRQAAQDGRVLAEASEPGTRLTAVAISRDAELVFTGSADGRVDWRRSGSLELLGSVQVDDAVIMTLTPRPGGAGLVAGTESGGLFELASPQHSVRTLGALEPCLFQAVAVSPSDDLVAAGCAQGRVHLLGTGDPHERLLHDGGAVFALTFLADGGELAIGLNDGTVRIVEASTGELRSELVGHLSAVTGLVEIPGNNRLATSSRDGTVRIWSRDFDVPLTTLRPKIGRLERLSWLSGPDGSLVALGQNGLAAYSDIATGGADGR
jgi:serine/threonine protein kinase/WD40 repeat protein